MSYKAASWAAEQRGIGPYAKVLLQQLADRHNPDHGCFPHQETLARDCEFSRSTINEQLRKLEEAGLVKRVSKRHPVTNRQEPTRYFLAFEDGFADIIGTSKADPSGADDEESRVREPDTEIEPSRVRPEGDSVSGSDPEPCPPARTRNSSLTSKETSKGTGKRAVRADREAIFELIWKAFPLRPNSPQMEAWHIFEKIDEAELIAVQKGAERFAQWFREDAARKGDTLQDAVNFAPYLSNWLRGQKWIDAKSLPVATPPKGDDAEAMAGLVTVNKWKNGPLFAACEKVLGRSVPVGKSGSWSFKAEVFEEAQKLLGSGQGPP